MRTLNEIWQDLLGETADEKLLNVRTTFQSANELIREYRLSRRTQLQWQRWIQRFHSNLLYFEKIGRLGKDQ